MPPTTPSKEPWWKIHLFRGMLNDIRRRAPFYLSDWTDAWDYRVVPATVYMYFANILPALAFSLDMFAQTNSSFGVNEVLLASVLGAVVFSLFAAQPLVIVGVTGPITVFNYTVYDIVTPRGTPYFEFMCWIGIWSLILHTLLAVTNSCNMLRYVTRFSCDIFGFYVAFIYLQKGIQVLTRQYDTASYSFSSPLSQTAHPADASAYLSITIALLVLITAYACSFIGQSSLFHRHVRKFIEDYGTPLTVIFYTGFVHIGQMERVELLKLPTSRAFFPTMDRGWFIDFWEISVGDVFLALPFGVLLTVLFWFDHNVSSLIAQGTEFPLRKPAGFHWDIFLLGLTTFIAGILGIPFPNGLIPQAPFHTQSLCVTGPVSSPLKAAKHPSSPNAAGKPGAEAEAEATPESPETPTSPHDPEAQNEPVSGTPTHVVEQRVSNLAQGLLTLGTMTGPLLIVLHLIPQSVLAGLFFVMGVQALQSNGLTLKLYYLLSSRTSPSRRSNPLAGIERQYMIWVFVGIELVGFGATFAITQTIAAVGFPVIILALIPVRTWVLPRWFEEGELRVLDQPTASAFTMESCGGIHGVGGGGVEGESEMTGGFESEGVVGRQRVGYRREDGEGEKVD